MDLFGGKIDVLERSLDITTAKHSVIASNVANVDTPGYKAKKLDFKKALMEAVSLGGEGMKRSQDKHFSGQSMQTSPYAMVENQLNNALRNDGNNVNIDKEMVELSQNSMMYNMVADLATRQFDKLRYAISEGRRA